MSALKHLKTLQHVSIIIQIIFRELVVSLLKSLDLKVFISFFFKLWRLFVVMRQHNVWCVCVALQHTSPHRTPRTHTKRYAATLPQITSTAYLSTQNATHTHQTLCCPITTNNLHSIPLHTERHAHTPNIMLPHHNK